MNIENSQVNSGLNINSASTALLTLALLMYSGIFIWMASMSFDMFLWSLYPLFKAMLIVQFIRKTNGLWFHLLVWVNIATIFFYLNLSLDAYLNPRFLSDLEIIIGLVVSLVPLTIVLAAWRYWDLFRVSQKNSNATGDLNSD